MKATTGMIKFETVSKGMEEAGIIFKEDDNQSILVWYDTIKDADYFSNLMPYQIVNRLPEINLICRKAPFVRILQNIAPVFSKFDPFLPQSFILPLQNQQFTAAVAKHNTKYIVKPDGGSLGQGITIVDKEDEYQPNTQLAIAQEYIESYLVDGTKFDLRVYALIASVSPELTIYVYHDGIARFCSQRADSGSVFGQLTNTAVNRQNAGGDVSSITKSIETVFSRLKDEGVDTEALWKRIETVIILTILSVHNFVVKGAHSKCPSSGIPRCFQILGFDILLDPQLKPWVMEVNYRPSLEYDTEEEKNLKIKMLASAMRIAAPFTGLQALVRNHIGPWSENGWRSALDHHPELLKAAKRERDAALKDSLFKRVFPQATPLQADFERILSVLKIVPIKIGPQYRIPEKTADAVQVKLRDVAVRPVIITPKRKKNSAKGKKGKDTKRSNSK